MGQLFFSEMSVSSRADALAELGQRMLRGEKMLADSCPNCPCPLMENARDGSIVCSQCHTCYVRGNAGGYEVAPSAAVQAEQKRVEKQAAEPAPNPDPPSRPLSALGGMSKVGQKLLEGWTMLSKHR